MSTPTHNDPARHTAQAMTIPKDAVGRNRIAVSNDRWKTPKTAPLRTTRRAGPRRLVPERSTPRNTISSQTAGLTALRHAADAEAILDRIREQRDRIEEVLPTLGVEAFPSEANFVLFRPPKPAIDVWRGLLDRGVLVRDLTSVVPEGLRVTAGMPEEVDRFLSALEIGRAHV